MTYSAVSLIHHPILRLCSFRLLFSGQLTSHLSSSPRRGETIAGSTAWQQRTAPAAGIPFCKHFCAAATHAAASLNPARRIRHLNEAERWKGAGEVGGLLRAAQHREGRHPTLVRQIGERKESPKSTQRRQDYKDRSHSRTLLLHLRPSPLSPRLRLPDNPRGCTAIPRPRPRSLYSLQHMSASRSPHRPNRLLRRRGRRWKGRVAAMQQASFLLLLSCRVDSPHPLGRCCSPTPLRLGVGGRRKGWPGVQQGGEGVKKL